MPIGVYERKNSVRPGERYGRWLVIERVSEPGEPGGPRWLCKCNCGTEKPVLARSLKSGVSTSCGCLRDENLLASHTKHGQSYNPIYKVWTSMHQRCTNPNSQRWYMYGARGISVDPRWNDFETFAADMGPRPEGYSIERIDGNGNYTPANCKWADAKEQAQNTAHTHTLTWNGETKRISEWAEITGIHRATIAQRVGRGMSVEDALTKRPVYQKRNR